MRPTPIPFLVFLFVAAALAAQREPQWVVPSRAVLAPPGATPVRITAARAQVRILERTAATTLEIEVHNPAGTPQEAVLLVPVPEGAAISGFTFAGAGAEPSARLLGREEARQLYDQITGRLRDPALLEFAGWRCVRTSVFPVPSNGTQRVRLGYEHVLEVDGARADYVLPRSETLSHDVPWAIQVGLASKAPVQLVYSPTHDLVTERRSAHAFALRVAEASRRNPGPFRLCFLTASDPAGPAASLFAYPDPAVGGGYFLLLAGVPARARDASLRRELTLVIDRSGSMAGRKLEQAKAAAVQVLEGMAEGEGIQVLDYGNDVGAAFAGPVAKDARTLATARAHVAGLRPHGGTNLHDALLEALRAPVLQGTLPIVLFLTDGLPTVGPTREADLRALVESGNPHRRRVFCFGVGHDVNVPLLDRIAEATRATTSYVLPEEDVERAVARTFARLAGPVLAEPVLRCVDDHGQTVQRVREVMPARLPDLFAGDQLVVLGQYRGEEELHFVLEGKGARGAERHAFRLPVRAASTRHAFVPRLWASRQIAFLVDELRQSGADLGGGLAAAGADAFRTPRARELRDEILRLSTRFGVLSEYTAFLATEGSDLGNWNALVTACQSELQGKAVATRSGAGAVSQGFNLWAQKGQTWNDYRNCFLDQNLQRVETAAVQQVCDRAFFKRGTRWIDGQSVLEQRLDPDERVEFASPRFFELLRQLEAEGRSGVLSLTGEVLVRIGTRNVLVTPAPAPAATITNQSQGASR